MHAHGVNDIMLHIRWVRLDTNAYSYYITPFLQPHELALFVKEWHVSVDDDAKCLNPNDVITSADDSGDSGGVCRSVV